MPSDPVRGTWPVEHYDSHNSRQTARTGPSTEPDLSWQRAGFSGGLTGPWPVDGVVYALDSELGWWIGIDIASGQRVETAPLAGNRQQQNYIAITEKVAYASTSDGNVSLFEVDGGQPLGRATLDRPAFGWATATSEALYVPTGRGASLASVDRSGAVEWQVDRFGPKFEYPVVLDDLVVAGSEELLYGFDRATGSQEWRVTFDTRASPPPVVLGDSVVTAHEDGRLQAFDADGNRLWRRTPRQEPPGTMAVDDETLYVPSTDGITVVRPGPVIESLSLPSSIEFVDRLSLGSELLYAVHGKDGRGAKQRVSAIDPRTPAVEWTFDFERAIRFGLSVDTGPRIVEGTALFTLRDRVNTDADDICVALI